MLSLIFQRSETESKSQHIRSASDHAAGAAILLHGLIEKPFYEAEECFYKAVISNMELEALETERLLLRKFTPEDYQYIFGKLTMQEARELLRIDSDEEYHKQKSKSDGGYTSYNRTMVQFQVIEKSTGILLGNCGFHNWYPDHKRAELGYVLDHDNFKQKGIMSEAVERIIAYGFNEMNLHRMEALIGKNNIPSLRIIEKNNFRQEGLLRQHYFIDGVYEDSLVFALLKEEYENKQRCR